MSDVDAVLARVMDDLGPDRSERLAVGRARVEVDGHRLQVRVATRGRLLLRITETTFVVEGPTWEVAERGPIDLEVGHRGMVKRTGTSIRVRRGGREARRLAAALDASTTFEQAMLPLDFTDFTITAVDDRLVAVIVLMGASMTRLRIPPTASYTRLHDDQRVALLATTAALDQPWSRT